LHRRASVPDVWPRSASEGGGRRARRGLFLYERRESILLETARR
jgi:hypothetical protein